MAVRQGVSGASACGPDLNSRVVVINKGDSIDRVRLNDSAIPDSAEVVVLALIRSLLEVVCRSIESARESANCSE